MRAVRSRTSLLALLVGVASLSTVHGLTNAKLHRLGRRHVPAIRSSRTAPRCTLGSKPPSDLAREELVAAAPAARVGAWPCGDALDRRICTLAIPALLNFLVLPVRDAPPDRILLALYPITSLCCSRSGKATALLTRLPSP